MRYETKSIPALQEALKNRVTTSEELVLYFLHRISTIDQGTPRYNSVYMVNPDALAIARAMDMERSKGTLRSVLHGIPVLLKDNINTADKQTTTAGANILKHHIASSDAFLVQTLREQGAIILGKTNLTELACFKSFDTVNGFSSLAGYVLCPWNIEEDPSGSSTGSAVSMALGLAPVAIGTETGGSIMSPSMKNGVVGLKPTIGFVSRSGIVPISSTLDTAGPMGRRVADVAALLTVLPKQDPDDPITASKPSETLNYLHFLHKDIKGKRIGLDRSGYDKLSDARKTAFDNIVATLSNLGCEIVDDLKIDQTKRIYHVMKYEFKRAINKYLVEEGLDITLLDIVRYNEMDPKANLKYGQKVLLDALHHSSGSLTEQEYIESLTERQDARKALQRLFHDKHLDMIYFATYTSLGPHCGFPTLSLPIGLDEEGMPIGTYFLAPYWKEEILIQIASALEQELQLSLDPLTRKESTE